MTVAAAPAVAVAGVAGGLLGASVAGFSANKQNKALMSHGKVFVEKHYDVVWNAEMRQQYSKAIARGEDAIYVEYQYD